MGFHATNFTVTCLLLVGFTVFIMGVRNRKALDSNWPLVYWGIILLFTLVRSEDTFDYKFILTGVAAALVLRFEFMNDFFVKLFRVIEMIVYVYVIIWGIKVAFSY